jgi:hypothetical protein
VPSPFTARLLQRSRDWLARDADAHAVFAAVAADPLAAAVSLRWAGALHHLALRGLAPWAALWPPGEASDVELDAAIATAWRERRPELMAALALPPQTNEVQRSAALLPGLLQVAARTGLPLVLLEIGASAGLNLWCDRYRYEYRNECCDKDRSDGLHRSGQDKGAWSWGDAAAPLALSCGWQGSAPAEAGADLRVLRRAACDSHPIDITRPEESLRLASFIWPDQAERLARLHTARHAVARWMAADGVTVEALPATRFVARELAAPAAGHATLLMHSVVWQYVAADERAAIEATVQAAAARASTQAPLAWLRLEPMSMQGGVELRCRLWPRGLWPDGDGGGDCVLARSHAHVASLQWLHGADCGAA